MRDEANGNKTNGMNKGWIERENQGQRSVMKETNSIKGKKKEANY